ncbi:MAG: hypothetical protein KJ645_11225 [Planctomycetes bacterium]|nr:hypothetical protein [Planctomycetota bacterium]
MATEYSLEDQLEAIALEDGRYAPNAYRFIFDSLDYILLCLGRQHKPVGDRHISVEQLLDGVRQCALDHFGPLSRLVLESWGVFRTEDIGEIVFNLVECGLLNKQETDLKEDFAGGFDFRDVFEENYTPVIRWESSK